MLNNVPGESTVCPWVRATEAADSLMARFRFLSRWGPFFGPYDSSFSPARAMVLNLS